MKVSLNILIFSILISIWAPPSLHSEGGGTPEENSLANQILLEASSYLLSKQSPDGSWRSEVYGLLKSGQSLTPFILNAYLDSPIEKSKKHDEKIKKAIEFLRKKNNKGIHGKHDPDFLDYPNYSTSYALQCFLKFGSEQDQKNIEQSIVYLQNQQFSENVGFPPQSAPYGGWGFGINQKPSIGSFVDLAHTRRVLESLSNAASITPKIRKRSIIFLNRLQKRKSSLDDSLIWEKDIGYDGGFFSSPTIAYANKGRSKFDKSSGREYYQSYATATCDGILSMIALGYDPNSTELKDAKEWLLQNQNLELPAGVPLDDPAPWAQSMKLYNLMVLSETYSKLEIQGNWRKEIIHLLAKIQRADGSFINNKGGLMKEDDPLLSTTYAIIALNKLIISG